MLRILNALGLVSIGLTISSGEAIAQRSTCPMGAVVVRDSAQNRGILNANNMPWHFCTLPSSGNQAIIIERSPSDQRRETVVGNLRRAIPTEGDVIEEVTPNTKQGKTEVRLCDRYAMGILADSPYRGNLVNHYQGETWLCRLPSRETLVAARLVYDSQHEQILQLWVSILGIPPSEIVWHRGNTVLSAKQELEDCSWGAIGIRTPTVFSDVIYRAYPKAQVCRAENGEVMLAARVVRGDEYAEVMRYLSLTLGIPEVHIIWSIPNGKTLCDRGSGRQRGQCQEAK